MGAFQGLNQSRAQPQGGQQEPQQPEARQQGFAPASQNMAMLSGFQVAYSIPMSINNTATHLSSTFVSWCMATCQLSASSWAAQAGGANVNQEQMMRLLMQQQQQQQQRAGQQPPKVGT